MTDFPTLETSRTLGAPFGLLLFTYGDNAGDVYGYTDAEVPVTVGGVTYQPVPGDRDSIKSSGTLDKSALEVTLPQDCAINEYFDIWPPSRVVTLSISEGHVGSDDIRLFWSGRVVSSRQEGNSVIFSCEPIGSSTRRMGLRRKWQYGCPHVLYGAGDGLCNASKSAASITVTPTLATQGALTLASGWSGSIDPAKYVTGIAQWTTSDGRVEYRQILTISSPTVIKLSGDVSTLPVGGAVLLALGCNHQMGDCLDLHGNIHNFGGDPWIPFKNPIGVTNNFY